MAKVAIKSEKLTPFGGIFSIMELFDSKLSSGMKAGVMGTGTLVHAYPSCFATSAKIVVEIIKKK